MPECPRMRTAVPDSKERASAASRSCHGERAITMLIWHTRCDAGSRSHLQAAIGLA